LVWTVKEYQFVVLKFVENCGRTLHVLVPVDRIVRLVVTENPTILTVGGTGGAGGATVLIAAPKK
jgi:hypothetical protein